MRRRVVLARERGVATLVESRRCVGGSGHQAIVIATRHHEHAGQVLRAVGRASTFVEKPLAITWEELGQVAQVYQAASPQPLLMVGQPPPPALRG